MAFQAMVVSRRARRAIGSLQAARVTEDENARKGLQTGVKSPRQTGLICTPWFCGRPTLQPPSVGLQNIPMWTYRNPSSGWLAEHYLKLSCVKCGRMAERAALASHAMCDVQKYRLAEVTG
jgi:hypothetical protein